MGSDQLWKPDSISHGYYTLDFVPDNVFKASYATSFGIKEMPKYQVKKCGAFLKRFDFLSTREVSGKEIIKNTSGKDAVVVADPTLMLTSNDWDAIQPKERIIKEKYIFCYFLGKASWHREFAKKIKDITGYKIVSILHTDEYVKEDNKFADFSPYDVNPGDFLNLIKNAEYVCTDSFHCSVFSVIFKKLFFTFNRFDASKKQSTNTRIDSLLGILKLEDRRVLSPDYDLNVLMNKLINYEQVDESLSSLCESSKIYLDQLISKIKEV